MPSVDDKGDVDDDEDCLIFPLTDIDRVVDNNNAWDKSHVESMSAVLDRSDSGSGVGAGDGRVSARRRCKSFGSPSERSRALPMPSHSFSATHQLSLKLNAGGHLLSPTSSSPKCNWMHAVRKIKHLKDPWERYHIIDLPSEMATRHRYHPLKKQWVVDKVEVKMEREVKLRSQHISFCRHYHHLCYSVKHYVVISCICCTFVFLF